MKIDVSNLKAKHSEPLVNNHNKFAVLADLEVKNDDVAAKAAERLMLQKSTTLVAKPSRPNLVEQLEVRTPKIEFEIRNVNRSKSKLYFADVNVHAPVCQHMVSGC